MDNELLKKIAEECIDGDQFPLVNFAKKIIEECITAVGNAEKSHVHTTFDQAQHEATLAQAILSIKKHFSIDE